MATERKLLYLNGTYGIPVEIDSTNDKIQLAHLTLLGETGVGIVLGGNDITGSGNISFDAVTDTVAGIQNQNLLDKTAAETISGIYTHTAELAMQSNVSFSAGTQTIAGIENQNLLDKTAAETISGIYTHTAELAMQSNVTFSAGTQTIAGIQNQNLLDKTAAESVSGAWSFTTIPTLNKVAGDFTNDSDMVNKAYVDAIAAGFAGKHSVRVATTVELSATYDNGTAGVGATLTNSGTQAAIAIDGISLIIGDRVLVKDQKATLVGTSDLSSGYTFTNEAFTIAKDGGAPVTVTLNSTTTDVATTVAEINAELITSGINTLYQAFASGNNVGIRALNSETDAITIAAGSPSALTILGWTAGTYEAYENGIYEVTTVGSGATNWVLTRATDADGTPSSEIEIGDFVPVIEGTTYAGYQFYQASFVGGVDVIGTNGITWTVFANPTDLQAGDGIDIIANVVSVDVTDIIDTAAGLTESTNNIQVNLDVAGALSFNAGAIKANVDNTTIEITTNSLNVKANGITATEIDETDDYTWTGIHSFLGGDVVLPNNAAASPSEGYVYWDGTSDTLYIHNGTGYVPVTGQDDNLLSATNGETGSITIGQVVYQTSTANTVMLAQADDLNEAVHSIGIVSDASIATTVSGNIRFSGVQGGLSGLTTGAIYYLSPTTAGAITSSIPTGNGQIIVQVGIAVSTTEFLVDVKYLGQRKAA